MANVSIDKKTHIIEQIKDLSNFFDAIRDDLCEPYGLSSIQAVILLDIYHHPKQTRVTDICKRLKKSTNTISPLINRMISKNLLTKVKDDKDTRVTNVYLTPKTEEITKKIFLDVVDYTIPYFDDLNDEEIKKIEEALDLILKIVLK